MATITLATSLLATLPISSATAQVGESSDPSVSTPGVSSPVADAHVGWDAFSRVTTNSDGSSSRDIFSSPVNYLDSEGVWQPIDTTLVESAQSGVAAQSADNAFQVDVPSDAGAKPVKVELSSDQWISFRAHGSDGSPAIEDSQATYDGPGNSELNYEVINSGVKESLVLDSAPASAPSYDFTVNAAPGSTPEMAADGSVSVVDATGTQVFSLPAPFMFDASDTSATETVDATLAHVGSAWKMTLTPDWSWLSSSERTYPVTIDPTVIVTGNAQTGDCWLEEAAKTTTHCGSQHVWSGWDAAGLARRALFRFYTNSIPTDAVVQSASLSLYMDSTSTRNTNSATYAMKKISSASNWSQPTWNRASASQAWTNPGGDFSGTSGQTVTTGGQTSAWKTWDDSVVLGWVQDWVANPSTNNGVALVRTSGDNMIGWDSNQFTDTSKLPKMTVTYDSYPSAPTNLTITPLDSGSGKVSDAAPTLSAKVVDPDGGTVFGQFAVLNSDGSTLWSGAGSTVASGSMSTVTMPAAEIAADSSYTLQVTTSDGTLTSKGPATSLAFDTIGGNVAVGGITVGSDGWITYNDDSVQTDLNLTPGAITTFDGSLANGSCSFDESGLSTSGPAIAVEVGYNPTTCQERVQVTDLTSQATDTLMSMDQSAEASGSTEENFDDYYGSDSVTGSDALDSVAAADAERTTTYPYTAWAKVRWLDPVNIEITSLSESIRWTSGSWPTAAFHSSIDAWKYSIDVTHIGPRHTHDYTRTANSVSRGVSANYYNSSFAHIVYNLLGPVGWVACGAHFSQTAYFSHDVTLRGWSSGHAGAGWSNGKSGACTNLVHHKNNTSSGLVDIGLTGG